MMLSDNLSFLWMLQPFYVRPARLQYEDTWAWEPEKHRVYSVRSAYRLLDMVRVKETNVQDASTSGSSVWKKVWKLKVPPKIKVF